MNAFRIADRRRAMLDGMGAYLRGGRWNSPGHRMIYCAETYSGAVLEVLVHASVGLTPRNLAVIRLSVPDEIPVQTLEAAMLSGWSDENMSASRAFGDMWLKQARTAVLRVPSVVVQGREFNVLLNPEHPDFAKIAVGQAEGVLWDRRLFPGS